MKKSVILLTVLIFACYLTQAQENVNKMKPEETEYYAPVPPVVAPGAAYGDPPADAVILFDGKNLDQWVSAKDSTAAKWIVENNAMTVNKAAGDIQTKRTFTDYQ